MYIVLLYCDVYNYGFKFKSFNLLSSAINFCETWSSNISFYHFEGTYKIYFCSQSNLVSFENFISSLKEVEL